MPSASGQAEAKIAPEKSDSLPKQTKKKRPRVRVRSRNKACRLAAAAEATETCCNNNNKTIASDLPASMDVSGNHNDSKTREQIKAEREAKKQAKLAKKTKAATNIAANNAPASHTAATDTLVKSGVMFEENSNITAEAVSETAKANENIKIERVAKQLLKLATKPAKPEVEPTALVEPETAAQKKPILSKAERRAIQEAQRAAKAQTQAKVANKAVARKPTPNATLEKAEKSPKTVKSPSTNNNNNNNNNQNDCKVKLFHHLERADQDASLFLNNPLIHPAMARLGEQYAKRTVVGSNARCLAFLNALKMVIQDFETPVKKEFARSLETSLKHCVKHLQTCRPLAVSVTNAYKHIKHVLTQLSADEPDSESKEHLCQFIDTYIENQISKAAQAISESMQEKIKNGDVILTFGCSSLINYICEQAHRRHVDFRVIIVDSRPFCEGQELLRRLTAKEIPCTYVLINAVGFVMPEATKVLLGAHALLSNGYVMSRTGTAQVALVARSYNVPVLVCCETHKFSERFQTDAIVYNELGDPQDLVISSKCSLSNWQCKGKMTPLNLMYDITPPELVTAVVTDVSILPCTSVPVILRIKPAEIGYYG